MKVAVVGACADSLQPLLKKLRRSLQVIAIDEGPEAIIACGGDGALIGAERDHPSVPKIGIRDSRTCTKCERHGDENVLRRLAKGHLEPTSLVKLRALVGRTRMYGLNDVLIRNADMQSALRFSVFVNDEPVTDEIIGDGLVLATPFGSSAYFRSITNTTFRSGIGLAFNNCAEFLNHMVLGDRDRVVVRIIRGPALITTDNNPTPLTLESDSEVLIDRARRSATILAPDTLRCGQCRYKHAPRRRF